MRVSEAAFVVDLPLSNLDETSVQFRRVRVGADCLETRDNIEVLLRFLPSPGRCRTATRSGLASLT